MKLKKLISLLSAAVIMLSSFSAITVCADEALPSIACTQSASFLSDGDGKVTQTIINYAGKDDISNINWNTASNSWGGTGVLEFTVPALEAKRIKSVELTVSVHNGSSRSGGRTYDIYPADITINADTEADAMKAISLANSMYQAAGVKQGETRTDKISAENIREYVKSKVNTETESKVQFAFSNSSQTLDIDPKTASISIVMYDGGVALDKTEITLSTAGGTQRLTHNIFGTGISESNLVWESQDSEIASVDNTGLVTPHKAGKTIVSVKTSDNSFEADCNVTVEQAAENITIDKSTLSLLSGGKNGELTAKLLPETAVKRRINWVSSDEAVATVSSNGIVTPLSVGETTITATAADNTALTASCTVTVSDMAEPQSISLDKEDISLPKLGATIVVNAQIQPSGADDRITWTSSDTKIAQVYDGVIVAGEVGTAEITATTSNGKTAKCAVTVTEDKQLITNDRFYTDTDGNIEKVNAPFDLTEDFYTDKINDIIYGSEDKGQIRSSNGYWSYKVVPLDTGFIIAFTECQAEHAMLRNLFLILLLVGVVALTVAFLISLSSANRSIKPVEESYNKQKQFVADASHELKTPLTTINTNVDVLLSHQENTIGEEKKWLDYIKTETERMTKLTNDLLYLARIDHDDGNVIFSKVSFSEAVESVILLMEAVIFENNVNLTYDITPDLFVNGSTEQLKQLVMILLDNAVKYTPKSGDINITLTHESSDAVLTVRNTGVGISEDAQKQIFERFYREDKSRARESGGYGLGLAIAKAITTACKGSIKVYSKKNEYTEFTVKIPVAK